MDVRIEIPNNKDYVSLPTHWGKKDFLELFPKMGYQPMRGEPNDLTPLYYEKAQSLLFPPSTDNPYGSQIKGIQENVKRSPLISPALLAKEQ